MTSELHRSGFVYVTIVRPTPAELRDALTDPEIIRRYWSAVRVEAAWERGAPWKMASPDGRLADAGQILEIRHDESSFGGRTSGSGDEGRGPESLYDRPDAP